MADTDWDRDKKGRLTAKKDIILDLVYDALISIGESASTRVVADEFGILRRRAFRYLDRLAIKFKHGLGLRNEAGNTARIIDHIGETTESGGVLILYWFVRESIT